VVVAVVERIVGISLYDLRVELGVGKKDAGLVRSLGFVDITREEM